MAKVSTVEVDYNLIYRNWRVYLLGHCTARHFGTVYDPTRMGEFPYANLRLISRATQGGDLQGDESSVSLMYEAEGYINNDKLMDLYGIDDANAQFFLNLGFVRTGDSQIIRVSNTVKKISSRFLLNNFCGTFLNEFGTF